MAGMSFGQAMDLRARNKATELGMQQQTINNAYDIANQTAEIERLKAGSAIGAGDALADLHRAQAEQLRKPSSFLGMPSLNLRKGIARVPGKGSGLVDKVPAMLAPGEAVLNKAAAQKIGRDKIAAANRAGVRRMGLDKRKSPRFLERIRQALSKQA